MAARSSSPSFLDGFDDVAAVTRQRSSSAQQHKTRSENQTFLADPLLPSWSAPRLHYSNSTLCSRASIQ